MQYNNKKMIPFFRASGEGCIVSTVNGTKASLCLETGSLTSLMTSDTDTNLSAQLVKVSPPWMIAVASTTAMAMPLMDVEVSKTRLKLATSWCCFGDGCFFAILLQHWLEVWDIVVCSVSRERQRSRMRRRHLQNQIKRKSLSPSSSRSAVSHNVLIFFLHSIRSEGPSLNPKNGFKE